MPKKLEQTVLGKQYRRARAYVAKQYPGLLKGKNGYWYAPLVEAHVAGAKSERRHSPTTEKP